MPQDQENEPLGRLLGQVCHLHHSMARAAFDALGLYRGQPPVLHALWEREGLTHTELTARLHVTPATISKMIRRMEKAGFVIRRPDSEDQRVSRVYLTDAGRAIRSDVQQALAAMEAQTLDGLTPEEQALLRQLLLRLRENLVCATGEDIAF